MTNVASLLSFVGAQKETNKNDDKLALEEKHVFSTSLCD
jgi:hypothetical protein